MDGNVAHLTLKPGQREMVRFFGDRQRGQLSQMLSDLAGQQIKVELQMPTQQMVDETGNGGRSGSNDGNGGNASSGPGDQSGSGRGAITAVQRQTVMGLPLVRELMESFDLSLVEVRKHTPLAPDVSEDDSDSDKPSSKKSALDDADPMNDMNDMDDPDDRDD